MEINKSVANPMLVGAIELMKAEDTPEHRSLFMEEVKKANFLAPVIISPAPEQDDQGIFHLQPNSQIQFPMLKAPDGKQFFMAYTDMSELKRWKDEENQQTFLMKLTDYAQMMFQKDDQGRENPSAGFVINPFGGNMAITKELVKILLAPPRTPSN